MVDNHVARTSEQGPDRGHSWVSKGVILVLFAGIVGVLVILN